MLKTIEHMNQVTGTTIYELDLSVRCCNALTRANIYTVEALVSILNSGSGEKKILELRGMGTKGLEEIRKRLVEKGFLYTSAESFTYRIGELFLSLLPLQTDLYAYIQVLQEISTECQMTIIELQKERK